MKLTYSPVSRINVMTTWFRVSPMTGFPDISLIETWISKDSSSSKERSYEVNVSLGKPIDILALKLNMVADFASQVSYHSSTRSRLFRSDKTENIDQCPICDLSTVDSEHRLDIHGGMYYQCTNCAHCFVINQPTKAALEEFYRNDVDYTSTYTDKRITETRVQQVAVPKAQWMVEQYESLYGVRPKRILDVGAGGGHFVYACKKLGMDAHGLELSTSSRDFCEAHFGFNLENRNLVDEWASFSDFDIISFWGLIEHVANPTSFLDAAYKALHDRDTLVIAGVPRWNCFSTAVQTLFPNSVVRHLNPLSHINCFTDTSLATAFETSGFAPVAAWYFGMDAYELVTQLSYTMGEDRVIEMLGKHIPILQEAIDQARLSDAIILAGKPMEIGKRS